MRKEFPARIGSGERMQVIYKQESWGEFFRRMIEDNQVLLDYIGAAMVTLVMFIGAILALILF